MLSTLLNNLTLVQCAHSIPFLGSRYSFLNEYPPPSRAYLSKFREMNAVYREYFVDGEEPARVTIQATSPIEEIDIEIEVIAIASWELRACLLRGQVRT